MNRILFFLIVFLGFNTTAQTNKKLDSLLFVNQRYVKEDTVKINILVSLSDVYQEIDLEKAMEKANEAMALAKRLNTPLGLAKAYAEQAYSLMYLSRFEESLSSFEQAIKIYTNLGRTKDQIRMTNNIGNVYFIDRKFPKAREFYEKAAQESEKIGDKATQAKAFCNIGNVLNQQVEYEQSIVYFQKGIRLFEQLGDKKLVARNVGNLGNTYVRLGDYQKAINSYFAAKKANEAIGNKSDLANNLANLSYVYAVLDDRENELKYVKEALLIYESIGNKELIATALMNMATPYLKMGEYRKSIELLSRCLAISQEIGDNYHKVESLMNLGVNYAKLKEYANALDYIQKAKQTEDKNLLPIIKMYMAQGEAFIIRVSPDSTLRQKGYTPQERYTQTEELLLTALRLSKEIDNKLNEIEILNELSLMYEQKGDFVKAYDSYRKSVELKQKLSNDDFKKQITRKEIQYEFDKKEAELIFQQKLTAEQLEKQRLLTNQREQELTLNIQQLHLKSQALDISNKEKAIQRLAYLKERAEKQEKEQQLRLTEKDKQLQASQLVTLVKEKALQIQTLAKQNALIALLIASLISLLVSAFAIYLWQRQKTLKQQKENSMNFTKQLLESTEDERKRIASDLHDSISHELLDLKHILKQDSTTVNTKIDSIINDIRGISRNLHPVMFDKIGLEPNIEQLVERIQQQNDFMVSTDIHYKGSLNSADELQIYRIIQEALTNIIKYAKAHAGKITMEENKERIFIEIKDNGKGFNVKEALNSGKSFGLHNIIERSRVIGGEAKISSSTEGTVININIPKRA